MTAPTRRFLILGLDGGTFDLLDPLMDAGELPFLKSLVSSGVRAPLTSVYPAKTIPAWYSCATGQDPGELGIYGFTEPTGPPGRSKLVQTFRPAEAMWDRLSRQGVKVGVVNFPLRAGYPLHGFVVPGMFSQTPTTYPAELRAQVEGELGAPYLSGAPGPHRVGPRELDGARDPNGRPTGTLGGRARGPAPPRLPLRPLPRDRPGGAPGTGPSFPARSRRSPAIFSSSGARSTPRAGRSTPRSAQAAAPR